MAVPPGINSKDCSHHMLNYSELQYYTLEGSRSSE